MLIYMVVSFVLFISIVLGGVFESLVLKFQFLSFNGDDQTADTLVVMEIKWNLIRLKSPESPVH